MEEALEGLPVLGSVVLSEAGEVTVATGVFRAVDGASPRKENDAPAASMAFPVGKSLAPAPLVPSANSALKDDDPRFTNPHTSSWKDDYSQFFSQRGVFDGAWGQDAPASSGADGQGWS